MGSNYKIKLQIRNVLKALHPQKNEVETGNPRRLTYPQKLTDTMKTQVRSSEAGGRTKPRRFEPRKKGAKASHGIDPQEKTESRPPP